MEFFARLPTPTDRLEREAGLKTLVKPLYVRTDDFRLAHRLLSEFNQRNLPAKQISVTNPSSTVPTGSVHPMKSLQWVAVAWQWT